MSVCIMLHLEVLIDIRQSSK